MDPLEVSPAAQKPIFNDKYVEHDDRDDCSNSADEEQPMPFHPYDDDLEAGSQLTHIPSSRRFSAIPTMDQQVELARIMTQRSTPSTTTEIPSIGAGRDLPPPLPNPKEYQVDFNGPDDPTHPFNWPLRRKLAIAAALACCSFTSSFGSSIFSVDTQILAVLFHVRPVVAELGVALYVMGFASGPIVWSPLSEIYGRKLPMLLSMFLFTCFFFATATAENLQTIMLTRFFAGLVGSAPLTVVAAAFADMFDNRTRGIAIDIFAVTVFCGPLLAPVVGGFIVESYLGWRWTLYITGIAASATLVATFYLMEETYAPLILVAKAEKLREMTGNWGIHAPHEEVKLDFGEIISKNVSRPLKMLVTEPIILLISLYNGFCYCILYLCLSSYPYAFVGKYGMKLSHATLPYIGILLGMVICCIVMMTIYEKDYIKRSAAVGGKPVPEARLDVMKHSGIVFALGLLWFFWSANYPHKVHWAVPTVSGLFTGYGLMGLFVPAINYLVDAYLFFAASALASLTFLRSFMGAAAPLFADYMFEGMGFNWAGLLLGLVGLLLAPVPFLFSKYGAKLRSRSPFAYKG